MPRRFGLLLFAGFLGTVCFSAEQAGSLIKPRIDSAIPELLPLYQKLHRNPELSFHEERTAAELAAQLRQIPVEVATGIGGHGLVGVLKNGPGPVILIRTDLDALPVREETGVDYASQARAKDDSGAEVSVMHACGHDIHMAAWIGTARVLNESRNLWSGTILFVGQPAEERVAGARAMMQAGLYQRFGRPDLALALHVSSDLAAGTVALNEGFTQANVDSVDLIVKGVGGHGAYPARSRDPIVLAAQIVLALQTIVSREIQPGDPAVITVGSIHGGTKHNIIPDEVRLQLTLRSYSSEVRSKSLESLRRIVRGQAIAAGMPEDRMPVVTVGPESAPALYNDPALTRRLRKTMSAWIGEKSVLQGKASMGSEDFGIFGTTDPPIPVCMFAVGAVRPEAFESAQRNGTALPSLHSSRFAPDPGATLKTAITCMTAAVVELAPKR